MTITETLAEEGTQTELDPFPISNFDVVNTTNVIASYPGSLTTPGCNEAVTWMVAIRQYPITEDHVSYSNKFVFLLVIVEHKGSNPE